MGKKINLILAAFLFSIDLFSLQVSVNTFQYKREDKFYIDVNLRVISKKITHTLVNDNVFQSKANVLITFMEDNTDNIVTYEKYQLVSKSMEAKKDILDVKTFRLNRGRYKINIEITDDLDTTNIFNYSKKLDIKDFHFSDIFLASYLKKSEDGLLVKNGYYMEPFTHNIVDEAQRTLQFYAELYFDNPQPDKDIYVAYTINDGIEPSDSSNILLKKYKKVKQLPIIPLMSGFDLNYLTSGDYHLKIAVIDENKKELHSQFVSFINRNLPGDIAQKRTFNQYYENSFVVDLDSSYLNYCLLALAPQHTNDNAALLNQIIKEGTIDHKKYYLFKYWKDNYPKSPQAAFDYYMKVAKLVDETYYNTVGFGFQTDRGYIYLKHGKPNKVITIDDEANTPPYEIWYYHHLSTTNQSNIKFIFYSPQLNDEYALLHSNCYGERKNDRWEVELYKNAVGEQIGDSRDATRMQQNFNRKARMLWDTQ